MVVSGHLSGRLLAGEFVWDSFLSIHRSGKSRLKTSAIAKENSFMLFGIPLHLKIPREIRE